MNKLISIIVPVYNVAQYLPKCIESMTNQTYSNLEILLVDDGATDESGRICDEYAAKDSRIRVFHRENGGQSTARNLALDNARGEYIAFVDSDDWCQPEMYAHMMEAIERNKADMAVCGITYESYFQTAEKPAKARVLDNLHTMKAYLQDPDIGPFLWNKLYKAELWDGIRFIPMKQADDARIIHEVLGRSKKTVVVEDPAYMYLQRAGSAERNGFSKNDYLQLEWSGALKEYIAANYPELLEYAYQVRFYAIIKMMYKILYYLQYKKNKQAYQELYSLLKQEYEEANTLFPHNTYLKMNSAESYLKAMYITALRSPNKFILQSCLKGVKGRLAQYVRK